MMRLLLRFRGSSGQTRFWLAIAALAVLPLTQVRAQPVIDHPTVDVVSEPYIPFDGEFFVEALGNRCVDFGGEAYRSFGGPVYIYQCNRSAAQRVRVKEVQDGSHDVELLVLDQYCLGVRGTDGRVMAGRALELQHCDTGSSRQRFALDGDAILMGAQTSGHVTREFVVEPDRGRTANRTPLVVGTREVNDAEYFRFHPVEGGERRPHSGFMTAGRQETLDRALKLATWGTVIELLDSQPIVLSDPVSSDPSSDPVRSIPAGVTLRGYRKYTYQGPEVIRCTTSKKPAFSIMEEDVRMTGFRLRGPAGNQDRCSAAAPDGVNAVQIVSHPVSIPVRLPGRDRPNHIFYVDITTVPRVLIDHVDVSYWNGSAIDVDGPDPGPEPCEEPKTVVLLGQTVVIYVTTPNCNPDDDYKKDCPIPPLSHPREARLRAIANFIHHVNPYGVVTGQGAFLLVDANVFYEVHNHAVASSGAKTSGYLAYHNLMLSVSGSHELDVHGSLHRTHWYDGIAGDYYDIGWNTPLGLEKGYDGETKVNVNIRGTPCLRVDLHDNVFRRSESSSIASRVKDAGNRFKRWGNIFSYSAPMNDLGVGDFDGDGIDDVFVGTGASWYFSSGGRAEWRYLNQMPEKASELRFGDFDGDRRTDVLALHNGQIDISWAGGSPWQTVNVVGWNLADLAVGDFDGDRRADLFLATDTAWFVAPGARNWAPFSPQAVRTPNLRFGDFNGDGKTDIVAGGSSRWRLFTRQSGADQWSDLHLSLSGSIAGVVAADFTGDGKADLARSSGTYWWLSDNGASGWSKLRSSTVPGYGVVKSLAVYPVGRFYDGNATADILFWSARTGVHFDYAPGGRDPVTRLSRQVMK